MYFEGCYILELLPSQVGFIPVRRELFSPLIFRELKALFGRSGQRAHGA